VQIKEMFAHTWIAFVLWLFWDVWAFEMSYHVAVLYGIALVQYVLNEWLETKPFTYKFSA
jgi:hypothetical protein